ncbi:hypothetical protein OS493_006452 [Desmophyllum pertusum]|uniref:Uncharacterized protein n=1 Tax=Desmophyllum pertusum TaxID=174260 RepID=A0A9X0A4U2_9CNID|nr:hypothetical protein OS493_006452 [Desmophyllum pertusum]
MQKENVEKALKYVKEELDEDVVDLKQTEVTQSRLKVRSCAEAGTVVRLRLIHKWGSETIVLDSNDFVTLADSTAGGACVPDREIADAELIQRHVQQQRGHVEIHYHQSFLKGHVCVAGKNTSLNMQMPAIEQRFLEAGPSASHHRSITEGTGAHDV